MLDLRSKKDPNIYTRPPKEFDEYYYIENGKVYWALTGRCGCDLDRFNSQTLYKNINAAYEALNKVVKDNA